MISIIIPVYNGEKTIDNIIKCLMKQTFKDIEIIVVNDGSTDNTLLVLKKWKSKIRVINQENKGVSSARNRGIKEARGEYLMFFDADDECKYEMIEKIYTPADKNNADYVIRAGHVVGLPEVDTIADGTAVKMPGDLLFPYIQENVDEIITVEDSELIVAFLDMVENHKMIVENSGLLTVAALKHMDVKKKKIVSILSGGNMDVITMASIVQHGLILRDRVFTVSVLLPDKPGELARVSAILAEIQANVIKLEHNQFVSLNRNAAVELRITMEAFGTEHKREIVETLNDHGYRPKLVKGSGTYND
mgnify:CR=1 FL=1